MQTSLFNFTAWMTVPSNQIILKSLLRMFVLVSSAASQNSPVSPSLACILHRAPLELIPEATPFITGSHHIPEQVLEVAVVAMLHWPLTQNISIWLLGILQGLINVKRFSLLARITCASINAGTWIIVQSITLTSVCASLLEVFEKWSFLHDGIHVVGVPTQPRLVSFNRASVS
jgi:hypothetical protein